MRSWFVWLAFGLSLAVVLAVLGWVSRAALVAEQAERATRQQAALEERVRLALAHLDSLVTPIVAQEIARPYFWYQPFYPAGRPYDEMFAPGQGPCVPSPLLVQLPPYVRLHFQIDGEGRLTSPQVPAADDPGLAQHAFRLGNDYQEAQTRLAALTVAIQSAHLQQALPPPEAADLSVMLAATETVPNLHLPELASPGDSSLSPAGDGEASPQGSSGEESIGQPQTFALQQSADLDTQRRQRAYANNLAVQELSNLAARQQLTVYGATPGEGRVREGLFQPLWHAGEMFLLRRVQVQGQEYVQGCWIDWPAIRDVLLKEIADLVPAARLQPVGDRADGASPRMLAALPVELVPPAADFAVEGTSRLGGWLAAAWLCVLLAAVAVAALLHGVLTLSARRGMFVSAVTHELRTPLTTLRLYAEMLAEGMVHDEAQRRTYLDTLRGEADRLGHLVENVLAYARLERGRSDAALAQELSAAALLQQSLPRLRQRAQQAEMVLDEQSDPELEGLVVRLNASAVEQILFNLVDNACKYGQSQQQRVELRAQRRGNDLLIRVQDFGAGLDARSRRRLFRPFAKPASEAARTAPGVGLGLALCRRLARQLGGDLWAEDVATPGACFVLRLPGRAADADV